MTGDRALMYIINDTGGNQELRDHIVLYDENDLAVHIQNQ